MMARPGGSDVAGPTLAANPLTGELTAITSCGRVGTATSSVAVLLNSQHPPFHPVGLVPLVRVHQASNRRDRIASAVRNFRTLRKRDVKSRALKRRPEG